MQEFGNLRKLTVSLPVWEEWIEITPERREHTLSRSLPVWEEWIEITGPCAIGWLPRSLPVWEEWIEIAYTVASAMGAARSLPVWEEWIEMKQPATATGERQVSSRMGRVD